MKSNAGPSASGDMLHTDPLLLHQARTAGYTLLSLNEFASRLHEADCFLADVRPLETWLAGHIPGARFLGPADGWYQRLTLPLRMRWLLGDRRTMSLFLYGSRMHGGYHRHAAAAVQVGWREVCCVPAGFETWHEAGWQVEQGSVPGRLDCVPGRVG